MTQRIVRLVAIGLAGLLVLGVLGTVLAVGLSDDGDGSKGASAVPSRSAEPGARIAPSPELEAYYSQDLDWQPCRQDFFCARLMVPVDYAEPTGDTLDLGRAA